MYQPGSTPQKIKRRHVGGHQHAHGHGHQHFHKRHEARQVQARSVGALVTATIDGAVVSFTNEYDGGAAGSTTPTPTPSSSDSAPVNDDSSEGGYRDDSSVSSQDAPPPPSDDSSPADDSSSSTSSDDYDNSAPASGDWVRSAYYEASSQTANGVAFLNNRGKFSKSVARVCDRR